MDPLEPASFNHCFAHVNGIKLHYVDEGSGPTTVLCVHGFPDMWYGWRYQIPFLVSLGYRVIVPDMRGYGQSDAPSDVSSYTAKNVVQDLVSLLDVVGVHKAVWAGHDWGGVHVWRAAMWHPERVAGVVSFCTPFAPTAPEMVPLAQTVAEKIPKWAYQLYFRRFESIAELNKEIPLFMTALLRTYDDMPGTSLFRPLDSLPIDQRTITDVRGISRNRLLSEQELQYYISEFSRNGMAGPTNYYRVQELTWQEEHDAGFCENSINNKCMIVTAAYDKALPASLTKSMEKFIPRLMRMHVEDSGHWVLVEQQAQANAALKLFLDSLTTDAANL
ncbi:hypothetical protein GGI04_000229 [Coemansia thaxteri]|uniref:AB hydrolase-1 domain-containing protein n=1 Tax=Coemansia thaxteri TaxID=2663907 RepID=A0A9W8BEW1_9FUNG|nr:hypothetical protein H4R26_001395 [Coemansia thaxteri]KAJ2009657.1 hypothetical protein GGI04_000229 [Coemansia thaxteri]KAJ2474365.1 hypothetical protein GGI02_000162 [Coemansia sp. RSA 2322]KAJ2487354.1 hypothetical protein EV174_000573 [Coemansia sp. RSA 2320]